MSDQKPLGLPIEHSLASGARGITREKTQSPFARRAAVRSDEVVKPQERAFPPRGHLIGKALDQVAEDGGA